MATQSPGPRLRLEFWRAFKLSMADDPAVTCGRASSETWMHHDGRLNCGRLFSMIRVRLREIGSQYALDGHTARTVYSFLASHRQEIEARFDAADTALTWRIVSDRMHEIELRREVDLTDRDCWPELFAWLRENLRGFQAALGPFVGRSIPAAHRGFWNEDAFFAALAVHNPTALRPARRLLEWSEAAMPTLYWGRGERFGSFVPTHRRGGSEHSVVSVWTDGLFVLRFGALKKEPPFCDQALRRELLERLNAVPGFDLPPDVIDLYPSLPLALLSEPGVMEALTETLDWSVAVLKKS